MKYALMIIIVLAALLVISLPEAPKVPLTKEEIKYGKQPYDFSRLIERSMQSWHRDVKDVKCYAVVLSPKHDGYISRCSYKVQNRYNGWDISNGRFVYNGAKRTINMIKY